MKPVNINNGHYGIPWLDCYKAIPAVINAKPQVRKEEEKKMNTIAMNVDVNHEAISTIKDERDYLASRTIDIYSQKKSSLKKNYGLVDDDTPKDAEEIVARINAGKYIIEDTKTWRGVEKTFRWRDPAMKEDKAGYDASKITLQKLLQDTRDAIYIKPSIDGLAAVQAFEAATVN